MKKKPIRKNFHDSVGGSMEFYEALSEWQNLHLEKYKKFVKAYKLEVLWGLFSRSH